MSADEQRRTADAIRDLRRGLGMTGVEFAEELSRLLGRTVRDTDVSKWENAAQEPRGDVVLAAMRLAGLYPPAAGTLDTKAAALERRIADLEREAFGAAAEGELLTVQAAADRYGYTKQALQRRIREGSLVAVERRGIRHVREADVRRLARERRRHA